MDIDIPGMKTDIAEGSPRGTREVLDLLLRATLGGVNTGGVLWSKRDYRFRWMNEAGRITGLGGLSTSS